MIKIYLNSISNIYFSYGFNVKIWSLVISCLPYEVLETNFCFSNWNQILCNPNFLLKISVHRLTDIVIRGLLQLNLTYLSQLPWSLKSIGTCYVIVTTKQFYPITYQVFVCMHAFIFVHELIWSDMQGIETRFKYHLLYYKFILCLLQSILPSCISMVLRTFITIIPYFLVVRNICLLHSFESFSQSGIVQCFYLYSLSSVTDSKCECHMDEWNPAQCTH